MLKGKEIKDLLKQKGFDIKKISVREQQGGYSQAFWVTLKDKSIDKEEVRKVVEPLQYYERDERTFEILAGGNTYIFVQYDYNL